MSHVVLKIARPNMPADILAGEGFRFSVRPDGALCINGRHGQQITKFPRLAWVKAFKVENEEDILVHENGVGKAKASFALERVPLVEKPKRSSRYNARESIYPFAKMRLGDSFLVPFSGEMPIKIKNRVTSAFRLFKKNNPEIDIHFEVREMDDGIRVWSVEEPTFTPKVKPSTLELGRAAQAGQEKKFQEKMDAKRHDLLDIISARVELGGISRSAIYSLIWEKKLDTVKIGRRVFIKRDSIDRLIESGRR